MSVIRNRFKQRRAEAATPIPQADSRRASILARITQHERAYKRLKARYDDNLPYLTAPESRAVEAFELGAELGILSATDRPGWVRKRAWS